MARPRSSRPRLIGVVAAGVASLLLVGLSGQGYAQPLAQGAVVSAVPRASTPNVLDGEVHAIVQVGDTVFVGGKFTQVRASNTQAVLTRTNMFAFSFSTGKVLDTFVPEPNGAVEALVAAPDGSVYAGGGFKTWSGVARTRLVKFAAATGAVDPAFQGKPSAIVRDLDLSGGKLYVSGDFQSVNGTPRQLLAALSPATGAVDPAVAFTFTSPRTLPSVTRFDITPDGATLVAVGNFTAVNGASRPWAAKFDLTTPAATLTSWYTDAFNCYFWGPVQHDIDFSPDGSYFVIANTGGNDDEYYACDGASRWETATMSFARPTWIAYTGSDSIWSVAVTGTAVYVGGHMRMMNNPFWNHQWGLGAVDRPGLAALAPDTGIPFSWNPGRDRGQGVYVLYTTPQGLFEGSDTNLLAGEFHARIGFFPLDGGTAVPAWSGGHLPGPFFSTSTGSNALTARTYDGHTAGTTHPVSGPGLDAELWSRTRCATMISGTLFAATTSGTLTRRSFDGTTFGAPTTVNLNGLQNGGYGQHAPLSTVLAGCTSLFYDHGRLYYVSGGDGRLYSRAFNPESGILDAVERVDDDGTHGTSYAQTSLSFTVVDGSLYAVSNSTGRLYRRAWSAANPTAGGSLVAVSGPDVDGQSWTGANVFFALSR